MEKALKESEEKFRNIFEHAREGIYQTSPEGRIVSANPAFARILGYGSPEHIIKSVKCREAEGQPIEGRGIVGIIESNLNDILSPFIKDMTARYANFTPKEIQIADLMKKGRTTKEISQILNLSMRTIDIHRYNIRRKLNITNKKVNLQSYLLSLS
jgi:DNA-binding CsgD family transcriptional regulator